MTEFKHPKLPIGVDIENKTVLKQASLANQKLAELKGMLHAIPNEMILVNTLSLQEAKDSSEIENIVTTQDELFHFELQLNPYNQHPAAKEVYKYKEALTVGYEEVKINNQLTNKTILKVQEVLIGNTAGFRKMPGTKLKNNFGDIVYTPPQNPDDVGKLMNDLEKFINGYGMEELDPLVRMAVIHRHFESIHPFYDGNGRTGRIICILFLVANGLLEIPALYLSRYITHNKLEYYRLLNDLNQDDSSVEPWQNWILFMLKGVETIASESIEMVKGIRDLMLKFKKLLKPAFGSSYKHDLLNQLFFHPYTKIDFIAKTMLVNRVTASKYLDAIVKLGLLEKRKIWKYNYYVNNDLINLLMNHQ